YLLRFKLTTPGGALLAVSLVTLSVGSSSMLIPVYQLVCAIISLQLISFFAGWILRPRLKVSGHLPEKGVVNQPLQTEFRVQNLGRWPVFDLAMHYFMLPKHLKSLGEEEHHAGLGRSDEARMTASLLPEKRGVYSLNPPYLYTSFPFNLFRTRSDRRSRTFREERSLTVFPHFRPLESLVVPAKRRYQPGGVPYSSNIGESMEYVGNREYRPGDPLHRIDFRSWGRIAKPVVREYQEEYYLRIGIVLDTQLLNPRREPRTGHPTLEAAISLAAAVSDYLIGQDHVIDLFAAGKQVYRLTAGRHTAQLEQVLEILACLEPATENPFPKVNEEVGEYLAGISCLIGIFLSWDAEREKMVNEASRMGCGNRILFVEDREGAIQEPKSFPSVRFSPNEILEGRVGSL
ncbi:MAG: DUF58 domain-containing protein, partial [Candidatus Omnitrophica bacterium]|nr:DUF58 domain-containing protein [Candidatus Omnitrophota bacterium]